MKKKIIYAALLILTVTVSCAQENKKEPEKTKFDNLTSKTGSIISFIDVKLPNLKTEYSTAQTRIRKIVSGTTTAFFYQIVKEGKYGTITASIEYTDLSEMIKALNILISQADLHLSSKPDYMENMFVTEDGFKIGYFISNNKVSWFIQLEKLGQDNTLFLNDPNLISGIFLEAKNTIEGLKNKN